MTANDDLHTIIDIIRDHPITMLTTHNAQGLLSHPMTVLKVEDDGEMWFFSSADTAPVEDIATKPEVNLAFASNGQWLSVHGSAAVITSEPKARELWNPAAAAFYPEGPESKELRLIRVRPDGAQYWQTPGGVLAVALRWAKARVTGEQIDAGESHSVDL